MRFQKPIVLLLAVLLLFSNVGLALNVHYCDDQIASVSLNASKPAEIEEDCCGVVEEKSHCCKDRVVFIEKKSDQALLQSFAFEWAVAVLPNFSSPVFSAPSVFHSPKQLAAYYCDAHAPPLFKLYSQYIFYDAV